MTLETVIGLEIHVQLSTNSKIFCGCSTHFGAAPNANTCPVCLALPGALPALNQSVVESAVQMGLATNCSIRLDSQFARKNYFYPDLPKAYQISQFDRPICEEGYLDIEVSGKSRRINITRIHMEEDAGKLVHEDEGSYVDLNRAGVPLLEIVSEPEMTCPEEAKAYMEAMHAIVICLGVSHGDMEKGHLRCDANVSLRPAGQETLGTRTEIKNLNSFRFVQQALEYEIERQKDELFEGREIVQETRLWDADNKKTYRMRGKEDAHDYRYFPDPDLPVVYVEERMVESFRKNLPELPDAQRKRFMEEYSLSPYDAGVLTANQELAKYFEETLSGKVSPKQVCNWILGDFSRAMNDTGKSIRSLGIPPEHLADLVRSLESDEISSKIAKTIFETMLKSGGSPQSIIEEKGLKQESDTGALSALIQEILGENQKQVEQYNSGKTKLMGFFVGQVMKATRGRANPKVLTPLLQEELNQLK